MAQETLSWKKKVWKCVQKIPLRSGAYKGCGRESWKLQLKFRNDDVGMRPSCRTQLWPFRPAWWVGHGLGSTVLIFLPPLSFPLPPSLPPFLLELGLSDAPWMRGGGASEQFTMFLFHLLVVSLALLSRWVSSLGGSDPPAFISHVAEHANPRAAVCGSQRAFGETESVCSLF